MTCWTVYRKLLLHSYLKPNSRRSWCLRGLHTDVLDRSSQIIIWDSREKQQQAFVLSSTKLSFSRWGPFLLSWRSKDVQKRVYAVQVLSIHHLRLQERTAILWRSWMRRAFSVTTIANSMGSKWRNFQWAELVHMHKFYMVLGQTFCEESKARYLVALSNSAESVFWEC